MLSHSQDNIPMCGPPPRILFYFAKNRVLIKDHIEVMQEKTRNPYLIRSSTKNQVSEWMDNIWCV